MNIKKISVLILLVLILFTNFSYANVTANTTNNIQEEILKTQEKILKAKENNNKLEREYNMLENILNNGIAEQVTVLRYHNIFEDKDSELLHNKISNSSRSITNFEKDMQYLKDNDYWVANLEELELFMDNKLDLPKKTVVITFDDGYKSIKTLVYPILNKYKFDSTVFIIGEKVLTQNNKYYPNRINFLSETDLVAISDKMNIQSHSFKLHKLQNKESLFKQIDKELIIKDFNTINEWLNIQYFAYPYKDDEKYHKDILKDLDIKLAFTHEDGVVNKNTNKLEVPRKTILKNSKIEDILK